VVHGRETEGKVDEFGVSGYVYKNLFLIFDRKTESLWYPLDDKQWTAVSGPRKGETIPFMAKPRVEPLGEWRKKHPNTLVLLGSKSRAEQRNRH
jgi:hypothetical protein